MFSRSQNIHAFAPVSLFHLRPPRRAPIAPESLLSISHAPPRGVLGGGVDSGYTSHTNHALCPELPLYPSTEPCTFPDSCLGKRWRAFSRPGPQPKLCNCRHGLSRLFFPFFPPKLHDDSQQLFDLVCNSLYVRALTQCAPWLAKYLTGVAVVVVVDQSIYPALYRSDLIMTAVGLF